MKLLATVLCVFLVSGCSGMRERSYGSWLDKVGQPPARVVPLTPERSKELQAEAAQLRIEAEGVRAQLGVERDRVRRVEYFKELQVLGDRLHPIEKALRNGGFEPFTSM